MTISDIITILSLIIAIVAIISEKNRKHLLLKFNYVEYGLLTFAFILINYFVFYKQFHTKGLYFECLYFENFGLRNPSNYSYLISILVLLFILFKFWYSFYPYKIRNSVINYYTSLIESNEIPMLLDIIEQYHLKDIYNHIKLAKNHNPSYEDLINERFKHQSIKDKIFASIKFVWLHLNNYSRLNKFAYASNVLHNVISAPAFIVLASKYRPYFFATIFAAFKKDKKNSFPRDLVNQFLTELLKDKNFWLIKELKQSDNFDCGQPDSFFDENKIIAALIKDVSVADANEIWRPFGEIAISEIENEKYIGISSKLYQQYRNDDLLWEYKVFISIKFFNILIIESIIQKYVGTHFFLFYYWYITKKILENLDSVPPQNFEDVESIYHKLINQMNSNLFNWLELANEHASDRLYDIIKCIGNQVDCITKNNYFGESRKRDLIETILDFYCSLENKTNSDKIRDELEKILKRPNMLTKSTDKYYEYIKNVWVKFDKIPHRGYSDNIDYDYFIRLKEKVIVPLGLNPDEY